MRGPSPIRSQPLVPYMRSVLVSLSALVLLAGCQNRPGSQGRVDSLEAANQDLQRQVKMLRDSLEADQGETTLTPPIHFPSGSAWLTDAATRQLAEHAQMLEREYPNAAFRIQGYTDPVPIGSGLQATYPSNWYLAAQRAAAVAHYLDKTHDVRTESLEIEAFGPRSAQEDETQERQREDRRVEIVVEDGS